MSEILALIELGSNAARLLLARITPGVGFRVIEQERFQTRLGAGRPGALPREGIDGTLAAVHQFLQRARNGQDPRVVAVATAAVRDAWNRDRLLDPLKRHERVRVRVLSARQEAQLGALAACRTLPFRDGVVLDLGGGSLQLTRLRGRRILSTAGVPLGAVRMTQRFFHHNPPTPRELRALRQEVREQLLGALPAARAGEELVGLGGTVRSLASMHLRAHAGRRRSRHGLRLYQSDVTAIRERLEALPEKRRRRIRGLKGERADIILAGAIVVEEVMTFGGYLTLTVCTHGVRDGILLRETFDGGV